MSVQPSAAGTAALFPRLCPHELSTASPHTHTLRRRLRRRSKHRARRNAKPRAAVSNYTYAGGTGRLERLEHRPRHPAVRMPLHSLNGPACDRISPWYASGEQARSRHAGGAAHHIPCGLTRRPPRCGIQLTGTPTKPDAIGDQSSRGRNARVASEVRSLDPPRRRPQSLLRMAPVRTRARRPQAVQMPRQHPVLSPLHRPMKHADLDLVGLPSAVRASNFSRHVTNCRAVRLCVGGPSMGACMSQKMPAAPAQPPAAQQSAGEIPAQPPPKDRFVCACARACVCMLRCVSTLAETWRPS